MTARTSPGTTPTLIGRERELTALWAAGAMSDDTFFELAWCRGAAMAPPRDGFDAGAMLAVTGSAEQKRERYEWYAASVATEDVTILDTPEQEHMDPLFAENDGRNRFFPCLIEWLLSRTPSLEEKLKDGRRLG